MPADPDNAVQACSLFGPAPFEYNVPVRIQGDDVPWSIDVTVTPTCVVVDSGEPITSSEGTVDGFPATVSEIVVYREVRVYHWIIDLVPADECQRQRQVLVQTATWQPGDYETNKQVVDVIVSTLDILTEPP